ncbi:hypothetical protein HOLleu_21588 [Holothuria leucospilota]|uniref:Uncharacterized protein n=1 Tax=Holothuria leucospilota TaxID=206669 RepID=A0A9Q1BY08_HOLLE|nr:hypothetical protein HOLleu_21588 [Holothuria leucospilota]
MPLLLRILTSVHWALCLNFWHVQGKVQIHVSNNYFDGFQIYLPVRRSMLQTRLDEINNQTADNAVKFFLPPEGTVIPDLLTRDQHVVLIIYGNKIALSFEESLTCAQKEFFETRPDSLSFHIPFLTSDPEGLPQLTLALSMYLSPNTNVIDPNFGLAPQIPAEELKYTANQSYIGLSFSNGKDLKLKMSGKVSESCRRPPNEVTTDFSKNIDELQISQQPPDFSVCDRLGDIDVDFCNAWRRYGEDITVYGSNVCQFWSHARNVTNCQLSINVTEMSSELRNILALPHCEQPEVIEAETFKGFYGIGLISPCV